MKSNQTFFKKHYHWIVAGVLLFMIFVHGGAGNNLNSLHLVPVSEHLGISRAEFSLALSGKTILAMVGTFVSGFIIQRFGARLSVSISLFGTRAQAQYTGIFIAMCSAANFLADYASNLLHGAFGSYRPSFWIAAAIALITVFLYLLLYRLADRDRKNLT